jgi:ABC-type phosphate transport system auxiliary subunit
MKTVNLDRIEPVIEKVKETKTVNKIHGYLEELSLKVEKLQLQGKLGKQLKDGAMENICLAQAAIGELDILDRII